jgi:radical SAM superfamily enzyme YgiQ (UPF0313 family)
MNNSKILIIAPVISSLHHSFYQIAALLNYNNYDVYYKDYLRYDRNLNSSLKFLTNNQFDYIIFDITVEYIDISIEYSKIIKQYFPNTMIIIFHKLTQEIDKYVLSNNNIDISAIGEEDVVLDIVSGKDLKDIKGISYRDENGNIIHNEPYILKDILDEFPSAVYGYEILYPKNLNNYNNYTFYISTSRGCSKHCIFCGFKYPNSKLIRYKTLKNVAIEIKDLINKYNINNIVFADLLFTENKSRVLNFMKILEKYKINIKWRCYSRVDTIDEELLQSMYDHGCYRIMYGIETNNQNILNFINKNIISNQNDNAIYLTKKIGIEVYLSFMIGFPNENMHSIINTINYCKSFKPDHYDVSIVTPIPGTKLYDYCEKNNLLIDKKWGKYNPGVQNIKLNEVSNKRLQKIRSLIYSLSETLIK